MSFLSNLRIGQRLGVSFLLILTLLFVISGVAIERMKSSSAASKQFIEHDVQRVTLSSEMNIEAQAAALRLLQILSTSDWDKRVQLYREMDTHLAQLDNIINRFAEVKTTGLNEKFDQLLASKAAYRKAFLASVELVEIEPEQAAGHFSEQTQPALAAFLNAIEALSMQQQMLMMEEQTIVEQEGEQAQQWVMVLSATALILGIILAFVVSRSIVKPIRGVVEAVRRLASGDLRHPSLPQGRDEISDITHALTETCSNLDQLIMAIHHSSDKVSTAAETIQHPVIQIQTGSNTQELAVERISNTINTFSDESVQVAATAEEAKKQAQQGHDLALDGQQRINLVTKEFDKIASAISHSATSVETLQESAASVRQLVTTVREIAEQTNLLALNAAIEAARAGESGRGFSVVADEVRNLATRTGTATVEINNVIDKIDRETNEAVTSMVEGRSEMERGVSMVTDMVKPLSELSAGAKLSLSQLEELEEIAAKQANDSINIKSEIERIDDIARDNKHLVNHLAQTTDTLSRQSSDLIEQVSKFTHNQ
ncbi:methyl-accepting chemotaxis protein [Photobacterium alginatilyticum]|uniref:Methyl-accepting chemotaxis protein n=1 Tax=Photobacterium alginatilyticum TaxID=1775171 RepID=A0ABW9YHJ8_9GAMM|nr:methyl-accepting chemotaxis protein [Photobacterium alginatilyticum]NBI53021.1 methyl-accepting chemotaxis protein [Photobacterium alginatilyticum]